MKSNFIHICFVIDESSSMYGSESDIINGFQKIVDEQKANKEGSCAVSMFRFANNVKQDFIGNDVNTVKVPLSYFPSGCTAMNDGIGIAIDSIGKWLNDMPEEERPEKNLIVIMTDGEENSSREYSLSRVKEMIKHQEEKYNWTFMYIGTDITSTKDSNNLGISLKFGTSRKNLGNSYDVINSATTHYRCAAGSAGFKSRSFAAKMANDVSALNAVYEAETGVQFNDAEMKSFVANANAENEAAN